MTEFEFNPGVYPVESFDETPRYIVVTENQLLVPAEAQWQFIDDFLFSELSLTEISRHFLGELNGSPCFVIEVQQDHVPAGYEWSGLRALLGDVDDNVFELLGRALQVVTWHNEHRYCGRCGAKTKTHDTDRARICTRCELSFYPRLSPCVIVLVSREDECILGRSPRFPEGVYSTLAGFIEPGETVETALMREIKEEVGIDIKNMQYFSSQPWPFPGQLMLGFHAEYAGGVLQPDGVEIEDAHWFRYDQLPSIPPPATISGQLIRSFVTKRKNQKQD